jgi:hypothetical protein
MKTGSSTFRYDPQKIIQYVEQQLGKGTIDPKLLPDAAYCLLTHCTADESILDAFYQHPKAENL